MSVITVQPELYSAQLAEKQQRISAQFSPYYQGGIAVFPSKPSHYRQRAEFAVWHDGDELFHIMYDAETKERIRVDHFPVACELICQLMPQLIAKLKTNSVLRHKLFQIDYLATLSGEVLVSLIYRKPLADEWLAEIQKLKSELSAEFNINFIGRSRKQKLLVDVDYVTETLTVNDRQYHYQQVENSFTQPNAEVNQAMLTWAQQVCQGAQGDLLEMYCGNGNFSIALAGQFNKVLATEISRTSVKSAQHNIAVNQVENLVIAQMSSEDLSAALLEQRLPKKLSHLNLADYNCQTVLVDPPRAGLDADTTSLLQNFEQILYISCNPDTLARDLAQLCQTHQVQQMAIFDQFPYTHHIESGVWLVKR